MALVNYQRLLTEKYGFSEGLQRVHQASQWFAAHGITPHANQVEDRDWQAYLQAQSHPQAHRQPVSSKATRQSSNRPPAQSKPATRNSAGQAAGQSAKIVKHPQQSAAGQSRVKPGIMQQPTARPANRKSRANTQGSQRAATRPVQRSSQKPVSRTNPRSIQHTAPAGRQNTQPVPKSNPSQPPAGPFAPTSHTVDNSQSAATTTEIPPMDVAFDRTPQKTQDAMAPFQDMLAPGLVDEDQEAAELNVERSQVDSRGQSYDPRLLEITQPLTKPMRFGKSYPVRRTLKTAITGTHRPTIPNWYFDILRQHYLAVMPEKLQADKWLPHVPEAALMEAAAIETRRFDQASWNLWWLVMMQSSGNPRIFRDFTDENFLPLAYVVDGKLPSHRSLNRSDPRWRFYWALILTPVTSLYNPVELPVSRRDRDARMNLEQSQLNTRLLMTLITQLLGDRQTADLIHVDGDEHDRRQALTEMFNGHAVKSVEAVFDRLRPDLLKTAATKMRTRNYYHTNRKKDR